MKNKLLLCSLLFFSLYGYAQTADSSREEKVQVQTGVQFISNQTYAGRTDSLRLPVLLPEINLEFPKGFFINTKGYLNLSGGKTTFDGVSIEPGYALSKKNWNGSLSVIKNFISDSSNLIIAPVNASLEFYLNKETKILTPFIGSEYVFSGEGNDVILYGGLSKLVSFTKEDAETMVNVEPAVSLTAGSQNFYYSFLKSYSSNGSGNSRGKGRGRGSGTGSTTATITQTVEQQSKLFSLLSSSIELPLTVSAHKLQWITTPAWEVPINVINDNSKKASPSLFYVTTELLFNF
jgi:hypothetical protein